RARQGMLAQHFKPGHKAIASINSPMQCMMKEICAQCLQVHRDPASGVESVVFSCFNQDQDLDRVDFDNLRPRLSQNGAQDRLTRLWTGRSLRQLGLGQAAESPHSAFAITRSLNFWIVPVDVRGNSENTT